MCLALHPKSLRSFFLWSIKPNVSYLPRHHSRGTYICTPRFQEGIYKRCVDYLSLSHRRHLHHSEIIADFLVFCNFVCEYSQSYSGIYTIVYIPLNSYRWTYCIFPKATAYVWPNWPGKKYTERIHSQNGILQQCVYFEGSVGVYDIHTLK